MTVSDSEPDIDPNAIDPDDQANEIAAPTARDVCEYLVTSLVEDPDGVRVDVVDGRRTTIEVHVADGDMGRVIGKRGRVAQSIRTVVRAAAARDGYEVDVEFAE